MSNEPTTEERLAALRQRQKARPQADSPLDPPTPGPQARQAKQRRSPAATARYVTVGASTSAVMGLMGAFTGLAANTESGTDQGEAIDPSVGWAAAADGSQSIAVEADAAVVMVVVDSAGRPVELRSIESAQHLAVLLGSGQPIIDPVVDSATQSFETAANPTLPATTPQTAQSTVTDATQAPQQATGQTVQQTPTPSPSTAPQTTAAPQPAPAPETTAAPQPASETTPAPAPAPAPETTVPVAQPAPIELKLPTPAPTQGNSGGS